MKTLLRQARLETKRFVRQRDDIFWTLGFPMFFIVLFGLVYGDMRWEEFGIRATDYILPGIVVMAVMVTRAGIGAVWRELLAVAGWFAGAFSGAVLRVRWE